jgi:nucleotide-binding universal stress UspA family protein
MTRPVVVPARALRRLTPLLGAAGWTAEAAPAGSADDLAGALALGAEGRDVVFVPPRARLARALRRIVVLHEGGPAADPGVDAANEAAVASGAEIVVVHVASIEPPSEAGSLPAPRFADHGYYDWLEWRREFLRRFGRASEGTSLRLEVALGPAHDTILERARRLRASLLVVTWKGEPGAGHAETLKAVAADAPCPVLILPERTGATRSRRRRRSAARR